MRAADVLIFTVCVNRSGFRQEENDDVDEEGEEQQERGGGDEKKKRHVPNPINDSWQSWRSQL